jgi:GNAT superfamily N-acetyltransferase
MPITVTFLELTDPAEIRPPERPPRRAYELARTDDPALGRSLYERIGAPHSWVARDPWSLERWREWLESGEAWIAAVDGEPAGMFSLRTDDDPVEIDVFGLLPGYQGLGIGGHLLTDALRRGFELGDRVWLHTCTLDSPHALPNYEARGMRAYRSERRYEPAPQG